MRPPRKNHCLSSTPHAPVFYFIKILSSTFRRSLSFGAIPYLRRLTAMFPAWKSWFKPTPFSVGFVVDRVALEQGFFRALLFCSPLSVSFHPSSILIHRVHYVVSAVDNAVKKHTHTHTHTHSFRQIFPPTPCMQFCSTW
jgi:hypothetical protein